MCLLARLKLPHVVAKIKMACFLCMHSTWCPTYKLIWPTVIFFNELARPSVKIWVKISLTKTVPHLNNQREREKQWFYPIKHKLQSKQIWNISFFEQRLDLTPLCLKIFQSTSSLVKKKIKIVVFKEKLLMYLHLPIFHAIWCASCRII